MNEESSKEKPSHEIEVKHTAEGWFLSYGERTVGPFKYLDEVDHVKVAEQLGVEAKDVWKAKIRVETYQLAPKILEAGTGAGIELEEQTVLPSFEGLSTRVHPAIGIMGARAYVGVLLPCLLVPRNEGEKKKEEPKERDLWFLISSSKEKILANTQVLKKLKWKLAYRPTTLENRWSLKSIERFLNGATIEPGKVYGEVKESWQHYIEFPDPIYCELITLWVIGSYFFHLFNTYPYIYFGGVKRTGKTKALTLASVMAFNAIFSGNVSTASIFRLIQSGRCSLLMDESEKLSSPERAQDFRSLLLSGYKRGGLVYRTEKTRREKHVPEAFEVFSPKMLANIQGLEDVLEDRCIIIIMKRGKNKTILNREIDVNDQVWAELRDHLYLLYLTYWGEVLEIYQKLGERSELHEHCEVTENTLSELSGRELELWKPLFALAIFFDQYVPVTSQPSQRSLYSLMLDLAKQKTEEKRIENMTETGDYILLETLLTSVSEDRYYKVKEIKEAMARHWDEEQKWLTTRWVGSALKRLGFADKRRVGTGYEYRLSKQAIEDLAERLGIEKRPQSLQEKLELVLDCILKLQGEYGASKIEVANQLEDQVPREEVFELIDKLIEEGTVFRVDAEHVKKT